MILGYLLVSAVLVVTLGRLGDMFGRVRMYNLGFVIFTRRLASRCRSTRSTAARGALWLIGWRIVQAVGGSMLTANSAAILTDAFPREQRGMALGINQIAALAGQFLGLVAGGLLADDRLAGGVLGQRADRHRSARCGRYRSLREIGSAAPGADRLGRQHHLRRRARASLLAAITYGIQPYGGAPTGWGNPVVLGGLAAGVLLLVAFCVDRDARGRTDVRPVAVPDPCVQRRQPRRAADRHRRAAACSSC